MKKDSMKKIKTAMMLVMVAGIVSAGSSDSLAFVRSVYTNAVSKIANDTQKQKDDALALYGKNLGTIQTALKQKGDIDGYMIVDQEVKRFQADKTVLPNASILLTEAVNSYQKQMKTVDLDSSRRKVGLLNRYVLALSNLVKDLMAQDKLTDAKVVGDEKKAMELILADLESGLPKVEVKDVGQAVIPAAFVIPVGSVVTTNWQYLCDIKELSAKVGWAQFEKGKAFEALNREFEGQPIENGMYAAAPSIIKYNLSQYKFKRLRGRGVLIDHGRVVFSIKGPGGKVLWNSPEATQGAIKAEPEKFSFDLDITGMGPISLIIDQVGDNNHFDDSVWMNVQVSGEKGSSGSVGSTPK